MGFCFCGFWLFFAAFPFLGFLNFAAALLFLRRGGCERKTGSWRLFCLVSAAGAGYFYSVRLEHFVQSVEIHGVNLNRLFKF